MTPDNKSSSAFFEAKYQDVPDPWNFANSEYELRRYDATVAALSHRRYKRAFEPGCSVGVLTERLAGICDFVEAIDFSQTAVERARERCAALRNVTVLCESLADREEVEEFDLTVLSEVGYYFTPSDWRAKSESLIRSMDPGTVLLAVHWLGTSADHTMSGDQVHEILRANAHLCLEHSERHDTFRLDRWVRA